MKTRVLSACVMLPLLILVYLGGYFVSFACLALSILGLREIYLSFRQKGFCPSFGIGYSMTALLYIMHFILWKDASLKSFWEPTIWLWFVIVIICSMVYGFKVNERKWEDSLCTMFGLFYVVFLFYFIVKIDNMTSVDLMLYKPWIWLVFTVSFGTDIFAYFTGYLFGKHKLCPELSPKKTVEGAIGGIFGSIILSVVFALIFMRYPLVIATMENGNTQNLFWIVIVISVIGSVLAQLGDLAASAIKRQMGIKDFGNLIPGHGGILDRFDSVLFVAPFIYFMEAIIYQTIISF